MPVLPGWVVVDGLRVVRLVGRAISFTASGFMVGWNLGYAGGDHANSEGSGVKLQRAAWLLFALMLVLAVIMFVYQNGCILDVG